MTTTAADIERYVNARATLRGPVSLTTIFQITMPLHLIALGYDEIAFVYADGSQYTTSLMGDAEYMEFMILRAILEEGTPT